MIVTVTPNPAIDETLWVEALAPGHVHRPSEVQLDPAGKGINVSRMAHRLGWPTLALGFLAGEVGHIVERALDQERVQHHFIRVPGQTRVNVTIVERGARATSLFCPGAPVDAEALARLDEVIDVWLRACRVLVLAGSLPPGIPEDIYARWVARAHRQRVRTIVDSDGEAGRLALAARPWLIKPNQSEAERLLGRRLPDDAAILEGARDLVRAGAEVVVISLGHGGAICVEGERGWRIRPPAIERLSTVGSGDSLVAGLAVALARGGSLEEGLRIGTAAGAATAMSPGTALGTLEDLTRLLPDVQVTPCP